MATPSIAAFSALDTLTGELLAVVKQTMQPTEVSLWLRHSVSAAKDQPSVGPSRATWSSTAASRTFTKQAVVELPQVPPR